MPDGKTHDKITIYMLPLILLLLVLLVDNTQTIITITSGYIFASYMFNGDLDIYSNVYRRWSIFRFIWKPYQYTFSHRSFFTHGLIIGTIIRLIYILIIPFIISIFLGFELISIVLNPIALMFYIGLEIGSMVHTISDYTVSGVRKL